MSDLKIEKIKWKCYFQQEKSICENHEDDFFKLFDTWIATQKDVLIDVVEYKHVYNGTKIFLAGLENSYAIETEGQQDQKYSFCYLRHQPFEPASLTNVERLTSSFDAFLTKMHLVEQAFTGPNDKLAFALEKFMVQINDRAIYPNQEKSFLSIKNELVRFINSRLKKFSQSEITWASHDDQKSLLTIEINFTSSDKILLENILPISR